MPIYTLSNGWVGNATKLHKLCQNQYPDKPVNIHTFKDRLKYGYRDIDKLIQPPISPSVSGTRGGKAPRQYSPDSNVKQYTLSDGTLVNLTSLYKRLKATYPDCKVSKALLEYRLLKGIRDIEALKTPKKINKRKAVKKTIPVKSQSTLNKPYPLHDGP